MNALSIAAVLRGWDLLDTDEYALQAGIEEAFRRAGIDYAREVPLTPRDRIDFVVGFTGVEVKVAGSIDGVRRQLRRYAVCKGIDDLVLVTTRVQHTRIHGVGVPLTFVPIIRVSV